MDYKVTDTELTGIADAIRMKGETASPLTFPNGFTSAINAIPTGGIIPTGTKNITANGDYDVESYASAHVSVSGITPSGTYSITNNGIYDIVSYASVDVNVSGGGGEDLEALIARSISGTFYYSGSKIGSYAFCACDWMESINAPNVDIVSQYAFASCSRLKTVSCGAKSISASAFYFCSALEKADLPNFKNTASHVFENCIILSDVSVPNLLEVGIADFQGCYSLQMISLPKASLLYRSAFMYCSRLTSVYLMSSDVVYPFASDVFKYTPIGGSTAHTGGVYGSIFVPASLYSSYLANSAWSSYYTRFVSV